MVTTAPTQPVHQVAPARRRFTTAEYYRMAEAGILHEDDRVELIDGEIIEMAAIGIPHANAVAELTDLAITLLGKTVRVRVQDPIHLGSHSEPQPDLVIARRCTYSTTHPTPADIFLVSEVADSSLDHDRNTKFPRYAAAGILESWLVDVNGRALERHTELRGGRYSRIAIASSGETLASTILPAITLPVDELFRADED